MSEGKIGGKKTERDISPSTYSQSSVGLEWDPSADVGTKARPESDAPIVPATTSTTGLVQQNHEEVQVGRSGRPRISRSRSYEYHIDNDDGIPIHHQYSLADISSEASSFPSLDPKQTFGKPPRPPPPPKIKGTWAWKRGQGQEQNEDGNFLQMMVGGFNTRRELIKTVQTEERPASANGTTLTTTTRTDLRQSAHSSSNPSTLPNDLVSLDEAGNNVRTNQMLPPDFPQRIVPKSHSMVNLDLNRYYLQNQTEPSRNSNDRSLISEWLEEGMTRSEKEHRKQKEKSDSEQSSSMIYVEVHQNFDSKSSAPPEHSEVLSRNIGVQTCRRHHPSEDKSEYSSIYHSTPADRQYKSVYTYKDGESSDNTYAEHKSRKRHPSPPQPFKVASRKCSHTHHAANHSRNNDSSFVETTKESVSVTTTNKACTSSSSELSPPCFLLNKLAQKNKPHIKKNELNDAIEMHREYHVKKVRHELKQLEKLNRLLNKNLEVRHHQRDLMTSNSSDTDAHKSQRVESRTQAQFRRKSPTKVSSPKKQVQKEVMKEISGSSSSAKVSTCPTTSSKSSKSGLNDLLKKAEDLKRQTKQGSEGGHLEKKLDELMDAFSFIAGMLIEKESDASDESEKSGTSKKAQSKAKSVKKKPEPVKPAVAYFLPFADCQGRYVFRKEDLDSTGRDHKPLIESRSRVISRQEDQHEDMNKKYDTADDSCEDEENDENVDPADCNVSSITKKDNSTKFALQEAFLRRCPNFVARLQEREAVLARIKTEREMRAEQKREWIRLYGKDARSLKDFNGFLAPKTEPRLMTTKEMKELTKRNYKNLPEVQDKITKKKIEEEKKTNRVMSQVFAHQLQKGVLKGKVNLAHSRSLLRR